MPKDRHLKGKLSARVSHEALQNLEHYRKHRNLKTTSEALESLLLAIPLILRTEYKILVVTAKEEKNLEEEVMAMAARHPSLEHQGNREITYELDEEDTAALMKYAEKHGIPTNENDLISKVFEHVAEHYKADKLTN